MTRAESAANGQAVLAFVVALRGMSRRFWALNHSLPAIERDVRFLDAAMTCNFLHTLLDTPKDAEAGLIKLALALLEEGRDV